MGPWPDDVFPPHCKSAPCIIPCDTPHDDGHIDPSIPHLSDTCPHTCILLNQNVNGFGREDEELENIIESIIDSKIHGYCIQETWKLGMFTKTIRGHTVFHHGINERAPDAKGRNSAGVMIILGPDMTHTWTRAGKLAPVHSSLMSKFPGRILGVTLSFPNASNRPSDTYHQRAKDSIELFLCSIYHPFDPKEQTEFYDELDRFFSQQPRNSELLVGADMNCNLGV